jgi:hypothetical protein
MRFCRRKFAGKGFSLVSEKRTERTQTMSATLARYLKDFSAPAPVPMPIQVHSHDDLDIFAGDATINLPSIEHIVDEVDVEHEKEVAFSEGYQQASRELTEKHQIELMEQAQAFREQLEALQIEGRAQAASRIDQRLTDLQSALVAVVTEQVVQTLVPVLGHALAEKAVAELANMLKAQFQENGSIAVVVRGPTELFAMLKAEMGETAPALRHIENNELDLQIEFDETVLVTRMSAWADATGKLQR